MVRPRGEHRRQDDVRQMLDVANHSPARQRETGCGVVTCKCAGPTQEWEVRAVSTVEERGDADEYSVTLIRGGRDPIQKQTYRVTPLSPLLASLFR